MDQRFWSTSRTQHMGGSLPMFPIGSSSCRPDTPSCTTLRIPCSEVTVNIKSLQNRGSLQCPPSGVIVPATNRVPTPVIQTVSPTASRRPSRAIISTAAAASVPDFVAIVDRALVYFFLARASTYHGITCHLVVQGLREHHCRSDASGPDVQMHSAFDPTRGCDFTGIVCVAFVVLAGIHSRLGTLDEFTALNTLVSITSGPQSSILR
ncbi:hypothetical protein FB45DRAFT_31130 [Roridomyces roridus]|uniref:Uncharacterized protein n=1 Tax=Roridomyces roridus TaxID=1738132 RepID=A0AAD7FZG8_9AGAR|nr:hypothetical protein FB45DRAFT_31130 [Roridomyces roridus]